MSDFKSLNLNALIFNAINQLGYSKPTPIQSEAIPHVIEGKDILGIAQTGTGKTAAFSLPLLNHLCENKLRPAAKEPRALILAPTRELAPHLSYHPAPHDLMRYEAVRPERPCRLAATAPGG